MGRWKLLKQPVCVNYPLPLCWVSHRMELTARNAEFMPCPSVGFGHLLVFLGFYVSDEGDNEFLLSVECFDGKIILQNLVSSAVAGQQFLKTRQSALHLFPWHWSRKQRLLVLQNTIFFFIFFFCKILQIVKLMYIQSPGSDFLSTWEVVGSDEINTGVC